MAKRYVAAYRGETRPRQVDVVQFLVVDPGFRRAWARYGHELRIDDWFAGVSAMQPAVAAEEWPVPAIESVALLSRWLGLSVGELEWFADLKGLERFGKDAPQVQHYHYRVFAKRSGSLRLIESPKRRLKEVQRQILTHILDLVPAHPAAHGFVKGRSIQSFAGGHVGQRVVLRMDLQDFFPSIRGARVQTLFRTMGYPEAVADLLGGMCTNAAPRNAWETFRGDVAPVVLREMRAIYGRAHLPQGAPTSPSLANFCAFRIDCRLAGLSESAGVRYTRYADDLAFSGGNEFERSAERFAAQVGAILLEEGFAANHRKTRIMRQGVRQHLAGLVVNEHLSIKRKDFDRLKAILTNCVRLGPESQNRDGRPFFRAHLEGRVGFVESIRPSKGRRLRELFEKIQWS